MTRNATPLSVLDIEKAQTIGAIILDTRTAMEFADAFIPGSINIGLDGQFAPWVGTLIDIKLPIILVAENEKALEAITRLARIGFENVLGYLKGGIQTWKNAGKNVSSIDNILAENLEDFMSKRKIVDGRKPSEFEKQHVAGALNIPLDQLEASLEMLDKSEPVIVHCEGGYRSMIAASIMARNGFADICNVTGGMNAIRKSRVKLVMAQELVA